MTYLLEVLNVYFSYPGGVEALKEVSLKAKRGEIIAVTGPNGCGKTTLLLIASGLLKPDKGKVLFNGVPLDDQLPYVRRKIGIVFQNPDDQIFNSTVYDEIAFALRQLDMKEEEVVKKVEEVALRLGINDILRRSPYRLSLGEKKKVALASILVYEPELVLLDEPTANLSYKIIEEIENIIFELRKEGKTVVVASHDVDFIARIADTVYVLSAGEVVGLGKARKVLLDESLLSKAELVPPLIARVAKLLFDRRNPLPLTLEELKDMLEQHQNP